MTLPLLEEDIGDKHRFVKGLHMIDYCVLNPYYR